MKSHEVLRAACREPGCKAVAAALGVSASLLHKWTEGRPDGRSVELNPLDRVAALVALTGEEELLQWLCAQAGGCFVRQSQMPVRLQRWWSEMKVEMDQLLKLGDRRWKLGVGGKTHRSDASSPRLRSREQGGRHCRFRLPGGRCGWVARDGN